MNDHRRDRVTRTQPTIATPTPVEGALVVASGEDFLARVAPQAAKPAAPVGRLFTARDWARGRNDALTRAFLAVLSLDRVEKKSAAEWVGIYQNWLKQPRG